MLSDQSSSQALKSKEKLQVKELLEQALESIMRLDPSSVADEASQQLDNMMSNFLEDHKEISPEDECSSDPSGIANACFAYNSQLSDAQYTDCKSQASTNSGIDRAKSAWEYALDAYSTQVEAAVIDLRHSVEIARATFDEKYNSDSRSLEEFLIASMKAEIATAMRTYEGAAEAAASTLASAASTLIEAYTTFVNSTLSNQVTKLMTVATGEQTFWQTVETTRDS